MCSLNCVHALQQRLVTYSSSISYYSQILALMGVKDSFIQSSSTVLYSNNLGAEEDVFFVFLALLKQEEQPKQELSKICFFFTSFFNISNSSSLLRFNIFIFFSVRLSYTKLMPKSNIAKSQVFYLHVIVYLNCTHKYCNRFFESGYSFETSVGVLFPLLYIFLFTQIKIKKHNTSRLLSGVTKLKKIFTQKE